VLAALIAVLLTGCVVGPKYTPPAPRAPAAFKESAPAAYGSELPGVWKPASPQDAAIKGNWWEIFNEPELNGLEEQLNINNQNIKQYFENFMAARAQVNEARAGYFPTVTANPAVTKSGTGAGTTTTSLSLPLEASWAPDLWGRVRNAVNGARYAAQVSAADLENERLTEQASLAEFYFELRGQDALQQVYTDTIASYKQSLELTRTLFNTGIDSAEDVAAAEVTLANVEEAGAGIAANRAIYQHAIATLIGKPAAEFSLPVKMLTTPLPQIPVGVPSELLQRRPDIASAERTMAEANAVIGVQQAAFYPQLTLSGAGGLESGALKTLFSLPGLFWSLGASAAQIIYDAGLRRATVEQFTAQYRADAAAYQQTVLTAFQQVEDYIATVRVVSDQINREAIAADRAQNYLELAKTRYQTGLDPYLNVLSAEVTVLGTQQTTLTLKVNEMLAAVELIQALGGGWNAKQLPAAEVVTSLTAERQVGNNSITETGKVTGPGRVP
jgi:NodT family efflux transporter outer membrane factor (OMF) lipoprotein